MRWRREEAAILAMDQRRMKYQERRGLHDNSELAEADVNGSRTRILIRLHSETEISLQLDNYAYACFIVIKCEVPFAGRNVCE